MSDTPSLSLEEEVFGPRWKTTLCKPYQAFEYFEKRFGLGRSAYYEILSKRLRPTQLAPEGSGARTKGRGLFCAHVVEECDRLLAEALARAEAGEEAPGGAG